MEFMLDVAGSERLVKSLGAFLETVIIFRAAVKINLQARETRATRQRDWVVALPERSVGRRAKNGEDSEQA